MIIEVTIPEEKVAKVKELINVQFPETAEYTANALKQWLSVHMFNNLKNQARMWNYEQKEKGLRATYEEAINNIDNEEVL